MAGKEQKQTYTAAEVEEMLRSLAQSVELLQKENSELKQKLAQMGGDAPRVEKASPKKKREKAPSVSLDDRLFNEAEQVQDHKAEEPTEDTLVGWVQRRGKANAIFQVPVREVMLELTGDELYCNRCGGMLKFADRKQIRDELVIISGQHRVLRYFSCTYLCEKCMSSGVNRAKTTQAVPALMKKSQAAPSTVANIMVSKYEEGQSLARQEEILAKEGVTLSRATMANWVIQCCDSWLKPLYRHLKQELLSQDVVHSDETMAHVLYEEGATKAVESCVMAYTSSPYSTKPVRMFEFHQDRAGKRPESFLKGFAGYLVTDGDSGYSQVKKATPCVCWEHMRELWWEALTEDDDLKTGRAGVGIQHCNRLIAMEKKCARFKTQYRKEYRQNMVPVLDEYFYWVNTVHAEKGSNLEAAVNYAKDHKDALCAFIDHGDVSISNAVAKNALNPFGVGKKYWLLRDGAGAQSSAIIYSLLETAKANGLEPYRYFLYILTMLPELGKSPSHEKLAALMPWDPEVQNTCRPEKETE